MTRNLNNFKGVLLRELGASVALDFGFIFFRVSLIPDGIRYR